MKKTFALLPLLSFLIFFSCDTIETNDFLEGGTPGPVDTTTITKKVLIEDFTGFKCSNCPSASTELHTIEELYPDKIVGIGIHTGFFANPSGVFVTDFRTSEGDELASFFGPDAFPIGMVNRIGYPENVLVEYTDWASQVISILEEAPSVGITISENNEQITVEAKRLTNNNNSIKLVVCITEDKIIDKQIDGSELVENYEHNHVLRKVVNGTWGEAINLTDEYTSFSFDYSLDDLWVRSNCNVIAYVYDDSNKEVLQVEKIHLSD